MTDKSSFEWDPVKNDINCKKHGVSFDNAQNAFFDPLRIIALDKKHSKMNEKRYFCFGLVGKRVITVRFTLRKEKIRIFGAGYWRSGRSKYNEKNKIY